MADVNVTIGAQGDITALKKLETGYQNMLNKAQQAYQRITSFNPAQMAADKQAHDRKMQELSAKSREIDRKIMSMRIGMAEGSLPSGEGSAGIKSLQTQSMRVNLDRSIAMEEQRQMTEAMANRQRMMRPITGAGRFLGGKVLKYGGIAAGAMGAYSLISNVMGELSGVDERNLAYASALSAARGRSGTDYTDTKPFYEIQGILGELGQVAYMTSKEMMPLLQVAKELGDFSKGAAKGVVEIANIGKSLGVDTSVISDMVTGGLRSGSFQSGGNYGDLARMTMLNQNMMHRATESIQSVAQVLEGASHGSQGVGAFGVFNILDTLNRSGDLRYRGAGGASAALRFDEAFRSGGNANLQYMQTLALNPVYQQMNMKKQGAKAPRGSGSPTNWATGQYDQLIADMMRELGAFATPEDLIKNMPGDAADYIRQMYKGGMTSTNMQRIFDVYNSTYGANENTGKAFFAQAMMARDMGISIADVGVFQRALKDPKFMERAKAGGLLPGEMGAAYRAWEKGGKEGYEKWFNERSKNQETMMDIAKGIRGAVDTIKEVVTEYLQPAGEAIKTYLPEIAKAFIEMFGTNEQRDVLKAEKLKKLGMGLPESAYRNISTGKYRKDYRKIRGMEWLPEWMGDPYGSELSKLVSGEYDAEKYGEEMTLRREKFSEFQKLREGPNMGDPFGANAALTKLGDMIVNSIKKGFNGVSIDGNGSIPLE